MATTQVRISTNLKRDAKVAAAGSGLSLAAWLDAAIMEKLSAAHYAERLAGIRATQS